jgi:hypothetical protein
MNETVFLWILGGYAAAIAWLVLSNMQSHTEINTRLVKVEVVLTMFGEKAAKILHSPHTPELDSLLEHYWDNHYDLSNGEWVRLREICEEVENDPIQPGDKRALAAFVACLAYHKLRMHAPKPTRHD